MLTLVCQNCCLENDPPSDWQPMLPKKHHQKLKEKSHCVKNYKSKPLFTIKRSCYQQRLQTYLGEFVKAEQVALRVCVVLLACKSSVAIHDERNVPRNVTGTEYAVTEPMYKRPIVFTNPRHCNPKFQNTF